MSDAEPIESWQVTDKRCEVPKASAFTDVQIAEIGESRDGRQVLDRATPECQGVEAEETREGQKVFEGSAALKIQLLKLAQMGEWREVSDLRTAFETEGLQSRNRRDFMEILDIWVCDREVLKMR